jgi:alpha-1,2-mannosyltransferase
MITQPPHFARLIGLAREKPMIVAGWLFAFVLAYGLVANDLHYAFSHDGWRAGPGARLGRDFANLFTAGHLVLEGKLRIIYDVAAYRRYQMGLLHGTVINHNYSYSPVSFFYAWIFGLPGYGPSYLLWMGLTGALFLLAARPYLKDAGLPVWLSLAAPAAVVNIWAGHYGFAFGALWLAAWRCIDERPRTAGILIGLMIVKPHLALLMPLMLARRGAWRTFFWAASTCLLLVLSSGLVFGWGYWSTYLTHTSAFQAAMINQTGEFYLRMMPTVFPAMLLAGVGSTVALITQVVCGLGAAAALWKWMPKDPMQAGLAVATATFLVLPYAFNYDLTVVGLAALIALHRPDRPAPASERFVLTIAFLLPLLVVAMNNLGIPLAPPVLIALLGLLLRPRHAERHHFALRAREHDLDRALAPEGCR